MQRQSYCRWKVHGQCLARGGDLIPEDDQGCLFPRGKKNEVPEGWIECFFGRTSVIIRPAAINTM